MEFSNELKNFASRIQGMASIVQTEEATKNALIMPFIQLLGYNVFDPLEVTPELIADVGTKKGEKVDYAILKDSKPIILFECKKAGVDLNIQNTSQLFRYFHTTESRFGVLTNGLKYLFFSDLEKPNKMDTKPFFEFDFQNFKDQDVEDLKKFSKSKFDVDVILNNAADLKYTHAIKNTLITWMSNPTDDFIRLVSADLVGGRRFTPALKEQFSHFAKRAFSQLIADRINDRLREAMTFDANSTASNNNVGTAEEIIETHDAIQTTEIEKEAYYIIKSIIRNIISPARVFIRDSQAYCAIIIDDNNRKTICRLRFNGKTKMYIGFLNDKKEEEKIQIDDVYDLYNFSEQLNQSVLKYLDSSGKDFSDKVS